MPFPFRVHIHLGAHKTATTFIQDWLFNNKAVLRQHQIAYIPLDTLRKNFSQTFLELVNANPASVQLAADKISQLHAIIKTDIEALGLDVSEIKLLVLSEENLLGVMGSLTKQGLLYPALKTKMRWLAAIFAGCDVQTFMAIRNYREFYPSAYAETLRAGHIKPFEAFLAHLDVSGNSWLTVVDTVETALGPLKLWTYEDFRGNSAQVLSELLQIPVTPDMIRKKTPVRPSLSQKGLALVMQYQDSLSNVELKRLVNVLADKMVFEQPDAPIAIADSDLAERLATKYRQELAQLAGRFIVPPTIVGTTTQSVIEKPPLPKADLADPRIISQAKQPEMPLPEMPLNGSRFFINLPNYRIEMLLTDQTNNLIVTFEPMGRRKELGEQREGWGMSFLQNQGYSVMAVMVNKYDWYRQADLRTFFAQLRVRGFFQGFAKVITYGGSMGGFAALAHADAVQATTVLAINPQVSLSAQLAPWETRFPSVNRDGWQSDCHNAADGIQHTQAVYVVYDPFFALDAKQVGLLTAANRQVVKLKVMGVGHHMPNWLAAMDMLKPTVTNLCTGQFSAVDFHQQARKRRTLKRYWQTMLDVPRVVKSPKFTAIVRRFAEKYGFSSALG